MPSDVIRSRDFAADRTMNLDLALLVGRVLMVAIFPISGYFKAINIAGTTGYFEKLGAPMPGVAVWVAILAEFILPVLVVIGFKTRWAALGLILYVLGTCIIGHRFWEFDAATQYPMFFSNLMGFMKNLGLAGGLGLIALLGPGRYALDAKG
jgi:putative oxidoreductase